MQHSILYVNQCHGGLEASYVWRSLDGQDDASIDPWPFLLPLLCILMQCSIAGHESALEPTVSFAVLSALCHDFYPLLPVRAQRLGPRERLMQEFGTMELYELRIQLLAVDTLLQNLENTEDSDDAVAAGNSDTSTANGSIKEQSPVSGSSAAAKQGDGAESPSAGEKSNASEAPPPGDAAGAAGTAADGAAGDGEGASEATGVESEKGEANAEAGAGGANAAAAPRGSDR